MRLIMMCVLLAVELMVCRLLLMLNEWDTKRYTLGGTQILFGIRGKRWDDSEYFKPLFNEYWTRPSEAETPKNAEKVENGCYW